MAWHYLGGGCPLGALAPGYVRAIGPNLDVTKTDALVVDVGGDGGAGPGDTLRYTIAITNSGIEARDVVLSDYLTNLTLVAGSIRTTPLANNDAYATVGNVPRFVDTEESVLLNDWDGDTDPLSVTAFSGNTAEGGFVEVDEVGRFVYVPPAGYEGTDLFEYSISDGTNTDRAIVSITVGQVVWFIDDSAEEGGDGSFQAPFNSIAAFNSEAADDPGDIIFLYGGTYTTGITLLNGQQLIGEAGGLDVEPNLSIEPGEPPTLGGSGPGITLASNNTLSGLSVVTSAGAGILGSSAGTLMINETEIAATGGAAVDIANAELEVSLGTVSSVNSPGNGIRLDAVVGAFEFNGGTIQGAAGTAVDINGGSGDVWIAAHINESGTGRGIHVRNRTGGVISFNGASKVLNTGASTAVELQNNGGATITFSSGGLDIDTTSGHGFVATGGGTVNVVGSGNTINTTTGKGIDISDTTIGTSGIELKSLGKNGGSVPGIILDDTGSGTFTITGTGTTDGSGGTIENIVNADAVTLNNTDGLVTLKNMVIEDISDSTDATDAINTRSGVDGIHGQTVDGGLTLDNVRMSRFSDNAVNGSLFSDGVSPTVWNGLEIRNCTLEDANRYHVSGKGDDDQEGMVRILGLKGTAVVENSTLQRGAQFLDFTTHTADPLSMTVQGCVLDESIKEFSCGPGPVNVGGCGISVLARGTTDADIFIGDPAETNPALGNTFEDNATASILIQHDASASGEIDVIISRNTFAVTDHLTDCGPAFNFPQGGVALRPGSGAFESIVSQNDFDQVMRAAGDVGQLSITARDGVSGRQSEIIVRNNTFQLPWDGPVFLRAEDSDTEAFVLFEDNTYVDGLVGGPGDDLGVPSQAPYNPFIVQVDSGASLDLTIRREDLPEHDRPSSFYQYSFHAEVVDSSSVLDLYLGDCTAPWGYALAEISGSFSLYRENSGDTTPAAIIDGNGNTGGGGNRVTTPPTVSAIGTINPAGTAPTLPTVTIP